MKVVLFCGGQGMRMRDYSDAIPKPMVQIGYRPILWHLMKYYAHYGHKEFILCLGYQGDTIKIILTELKQQRDRWTVVNKVFPGTAPTHSAATQNSHECSSPQS